MSLYINNTAYSSGIGHGSFLFNILCGVKPGYPLSAVLCTFCVNPFIHVFNWLSDNLRFLLQGSAPMTLGLPLTNSAELKLRLVFSGWLSLLLVCI